MLLIQKSDLLHAVACYYGAKRNMLLTFTIIF